jgi:ATP-dependent Clp protease ATP-binding subunit ClpA
MQLANHEAARLKHQYIGTEHILLALLKAEDCAGVRVLEACRVGRDAVRQAVDQSIPPEPDLLTVGPLPTIPRAKKVIEYAIEEARKLRHDQIGSEHVLLGLFREEGGVAGVALRSLGVQLEELRKHVGGARPALRIREHDGNPLLPLSAELQEKVDQLDGQIKQLKREKEEAVAASDFEKAARLRDQSDRLWKARQEIIRQAQQGHD